MPSTKQASGFTKVPNYIMKFPHLSNGAKVLYVLLLSRTNVLRDKDYHTWVGNAALMAEMNCSRRQVQMYLAELVKKKAVTVDAHPRGRTVTFVESWDGVRSEDFE